MISLRVARDASTGRATPAADEWDSGVTEAVSDATRIDVVALRDQRQKRVVGVACVAGMAITGIAMVVRVALTGALGAIVWSGLALCVALGVAAVGRKRAPRAAAWTVLAAIALSYPLFAMQAGGFDAPLLLGIPVVPILVVPFAGARRAVALMTALVLGGIAVTVAEHYGLVRPTMLSANGTRVMRAGMTIGCILAGTWMACAIERERRKLEALLVAQTRSLYEASVRDPLTQLYNRRYLGERLARELAYAVRHRTPLSVVLVDVDNFKQVNDGNGHAAGDGVLVATSARLLASVRREDIVARHGGEEFAILLRGLDIDEASVVAERIRSAIDSQPFVVGGRELRVAISAGCASVACCEAPTIDSLLGMADARLYAAKREGRNRVVCA